MTDQGPADVTVQANRHTFKQRVLQFDFDVSAAGITFKDGSTKKSFRNYRASATISQQGQLTMQECEARIWGLDQDTLFTLTYLRTLINLNQATVTISAGVEGGTLTPILSGPIYQGWADVQAGPEVPYVLTVHIGMKPALTPAQPLSGQGGTDVAQKLGELAQQMGLTFQNNGVNVQIANPYYAGTLWDQAQYLAMHADIKMVIDSTTMSISPKDKARPTQDGQPIVVSVGTGMVGYPTFMVGGIVVRSLFRPDVLVGNDMQVTSILTPACGTWRVYRIEHQLESRLPGGKWFTEMSGNLPGQPPPV